MKARWSPGEDDMLLVMLRRKASLDRVAARLGCTEADVQQRIKQLEEQQTTAHANTAPPPLPSAEEVAAMRAAMDPVQRAFMDLCMHYNEQGEMLRLFSSLVSSKMAMPELEEMFTELLREPRQMEEPLARKLARLLFARCIVLPIPVETTTPPPHAPNP